jgi:phage terminase small subunit
MTDTPETPPSNLTDKQRAFLIAYLSNGFNATKAALTAGYSEDTARQQGSRLLSNVDIRQEIDAFFAENTMEAKEVMMLLTQHARGDIGELWDEETQQIDWVAARAAKKTNLIKRFYHKTTRISRGDGPNAEETEIFEDTIELHDPQKALTLLGKQFGLFTERLKIELTWQDETVALIKAGKLTYPDALDTFDHDYTLVRSLFAKAEVPISVGEDQG